MSKDWIGSEKSIIRQLSSSTISDKDRTKHDYYATPSIAVEKLLEVESFNHYIWEPACGEGHISKVLEAHGHKVFSTDLIDRGYGRGNADFLKYKVVERDRNSMDIITNPPYKYAREFVEHALEISMESVKIAMLLKIEFLDTPKRAKFMEKNPPKNIWIFANRIACAPNGDFEKVEYSSGRFKSAACYAWFVWEKGYKGLTKLGWLFTR